MSHKFSPMYPVLFAAEGERCEKMQYRTGGRVHLRCVRRVHGAESRHLFDIQDRDAIEGSRPAPKAVAPETELDALRRALAEAIDHMEGEVVVPAALVKRLQAVLDQTAKA